MKQWLNQHQQAFNQVLARMGRNLIATLMMCSMMGVTLCLPSLMYVAVENLNRLAGHVSNEPQVTLFLALSSTQETIDAIQQKLRDHPNVDHVQFVDKATAWQKFQQNTGSSEATSNLEQNPLPDAFYVFPKNISPESIAQLQKDMQQWDGVELAQADADWIKRLDSMLRLVKSAIDILVALLGFALIAIIGNTIRLQILTQREEIEVSQLIGATNAFIRRTFLYAGTLYGLVGGLAAWVMIVIILRLLNDHITQIAVLYTSDFRLMLPDSHFIALLITSSMGMGWLGAYLAVNHSIARLNAQ